VIFSRKEKVIKSVSVLSFKQCDCLGSEVTLGIEPFDIHIVDEVKIMV